MFSLDYRTGTLVTSNQMENAQERGVLKRWPLGFPLLEILSGALLTVTPISYSGLGHGPTLSPEEISDC